VVTGQTNLEKVKAVQWGVEHEADAIHHYEAETSTKVEPCGLLLAPNAFVGASPDGFVGEDTVVEVKCPWRMKKSSILELCSSDKTFFLFLSGDDTYALKKTHDYYHQIQGQMYLSGRNQCHMIVWSSSECRTVVVEKEPTWAENLCKLTSFYCEMFLPRVIAEQTLEPITASSV